MKKGWLILIIIVAVLVIIFLIYWFAIRETSEEISSPTQTEEEKEASTVSDVKIIFLHHSTGGVIWEGGVLSWFENYNSENNKNYSIVEQDFPKNYPYGWENYPYDYWNIWVNNAGESEYLEEPTLEILTGSYDMIVFKHCFPVSEIEPDRGSPDIKSSEKRIENYKLQYNALKNKMEEFPGAFFVVWTGAAQVQGVADSSSAQRAKNFFDWVKNEWDEKGDNIFIFDFWQLETEGGIYLKDEYAQSSDDSHPNSTFAERVAAIFSQRLVDIIEGRGDENN